METVTKPMDRSLCPTPLLWEPDGACWQGVQCNPVTMGCDWRWQPKNWTAFAKEGPEGEMTDFPPHAGGGFYSQPLA